MRTPELLPADGDDGDGGRYRCARCTNTFPSYEQWDGHDCASLRHVDDDGDQDGGVAHV